MCFCLFSSQNSQARRLLLTDKLKFYLCLVKHLWRKSRRRFLTESVKRGNWCFIRHSTFWYVVWGCFRIFIVNYCKFYNFSTKISLSTVSKAFPHLIQNVLSSGIPLAHSCNSAVHGLAAVHVLDSHLSEEEVNVLPDVVASNEVRLVQHVRVIPKLKECQDLEFSSS